MVPDGCHYDSERSDRSECPWSEWTSIRGFFALTKETIPYPYGQLFNDHQFPGYADLSGKSAIRQLYVEQETVFAPHNEYPGIRTTQHAAIADALVSASSLWYLALTNVTARRGHGNPLSDQADSTHSIRSNYSQPYVASFCTSDTFQGQQDHRPITFPALLDANNISQSDTTLYSGAGPKVVPAITKPGSSKSSILNVSKPTPDHHIWWIELPETQFEGSSIGAIISLPTYDQNQSRQFMTCNIAAGWGDSVVSVPAVNSASTGIVSSILGDGNPNDAYRPPIRVNPNPGPLQYRAGLGYGYPGFPQSSINLTQSWCESLNPILTICNSTVFHQLMQVQEAIMPGNPYSLASRLLSSMIANGLARLSFPSTLQGDLRTFLGPSNSVEIDGNYWLSGKGDVFTVNDSEAKNWTKLYMESRLQGHAYNTIGTSPKVAIAILTAYCVFAICHVFYAGYSGTF